MSSEINTPSSASSTSKIKPNLSLVGEDSSSIKVVARFRPPNSRELAENGETIAEIDSGSSTVHINSKEYPGSYSFDKIFDWNSSQQTVFEYTAASIVDDVMKGYNGTVFAYGQTGAGKTFTMMGSDLKSQETKGLVPRIVERIFDAIGSAPSNLEFTVKVSFMEIYMERLRDLLNPVNDNLPVHEDKNRGVYVKGLLEVYVSSIDEVLQIMQQGQENRVVASTQMNAESSRSHSMFVVHIHQKALSESLNQPQDGSGGNEASSFERSGKLYLVDLAGSEKVGKTGATGQTLEEAKKINKSLSALGMVINALTDGKSSHIPYRDSKLTRILQESLGGNSRTTLIVNCSPSAFNEHETISTLRFGQRAKKIKNKAKMNVELTPNELKKLLKKSQTQILAFQDYVRLLKTETERWRNGEQVPQEQWTAPMAELPVSPGSADGGMSFISSLPAVSIPQAASASENLVKSGDVALSDEERQEFFARENDLQDQLVASEKQVELMRDTEKILVAQVADMQLLVDKLKSQVDEASILAEVFKSSEARFSSEKAELEAKMQLLSTNLQDIRREKDKELEAERQRFKEEKLKLLLHSALEPEETAADEAVSGVRIEQKTAIEAQLKVLEAQRIRWMKDVQDRCEKVVDLEMQLAELSDENERLKGESQRLTPSKAKLDLLEHNLDQLAQVQMHLVNEITTVRRQHQVDKLRLQQKDERLLALESFVQGLQLNLEKENEQWSGKFTTIINGARTAKPESVTEKTNYLASLGKIAKPLRGGGFKGIKSHSLYEGEDF